MTVEIIFMINLKESMALCQDFLYILSIVKYFYRSYIGFVKSKPENIDTLTSHIRTTYDVKTGGKANALIILRACAGTLRYLPTCKNIIQIVYYSNSPRA